MTVVETVRHTTMEDIFVRISGLKVRIRRRPGTGMPILLINGLGACLEAWEPMTRLLPGRDLIAVDHPGTGLSSPPDRVLTMTEIAHFYTVVLDALDVERADLLGFSFGGTIAQQLAREHPSRVHALILCGTAPGVGGVLPDPLTLLTASNPLRYVVPAIRELAAPIIYKGRSGRDPRLFTTELAGWEAHRTTLLGVGAQIMAFAGWSSVPWLAALDQPTLILAGEEDPMAPVGNSRLMATLIPGAELHVLDRAGHLFLFDQAADAVPLITAFLDRVHPTEAPS
ncbi:alpha/beta hydrolase [Nocardioides sp. WV_118_6]